MSQVDFANLPAEVFSSILSLLDLPSVVACEQVSKTWHRFARDDRVWKQVASRYRWATSSCQRIDDVVADIGDAEVARLRSSRIVLEAADEPNATCPRSPDAASAGGTSTPCYKTSNLTHTTGANDYYEHLQSFRDLCIRAWCLAQAWTRLEKVEDLDALTDGYAFKTNGRQLRPDTRDINARLPIADGNPFPIPQRQGDAWRIKVCPRDKILLSTQDDGGICVSDLQTGELLWHYDRNRPYTHIEYDRGYFIIDGSLRGAFQIFVASHLMGGQARGEFQPYATVTTNHPTRALRFQYPFLCVATRDGYIIFVDIRSRQVVQKFRLFESSGARYVFDASYIQYIDFDDDFVFVVGVSEFQVMSRKLGTIIWDFDAYVSQGLAKSIKTYRFRLPPIDVSQPVGPFLEGQIEEDLDALHSADSVTSTDKDWRAVHPDFRTNTLVAVCTENVVLIRDYVKCFKAWERRRERGYRVEASLPEGANDESDLVPDTFVDIIIGHAARADWQLAVADSRAFLTGSRPMLIDLDPARLSRVTPGAIPLPFDRDRKDQMVDQVFKVYEIVHDARLRDGEGTVYQFSSCAQMDGSAIYSIQLHVRTRRFREGIPISRQVAPDVNDSLQPREWRDVVIWDFASVAKRLWSK